MAEETNFSQGEAEEVKYQERKRLLFFGLPWTFTKYTISQDMITVDEGLIKVEENDCYMYKVQDVKLTATLPERIFGLGTIICYTGDVTDKELRLSHIKHAKEIKNYLLKHEFTHEQWSGYHSVKKITDLEIFELVRDMATEMTWFPDCLHHFEVTNVGTNHDLMKILRPRQLSPKMLNM